MCLKLEYSPGFSSPQKHPAAYFPWHFPADNPNNEHICLQTQARYFSHQHSVYIHFCGLAVHYKIKGRIFVFFVGVLEDTDLRLTLRSLEISNSKQQHPGNYKFNPLECLFSSSLF